MNREFLFSLGITILTVGTLFLYFRHRLKLIEHKVNTIFQLVQSHAQPRPAHYMMQRPAAATMPAGEELQPLAGENKPTNLIDVSDDEYTDSEEESDSDDESNTPNKAISFLGGDIKQISVTLGNELNVPKEVNLEEKKVDLDDVESLEDEESAQNTNEIITQAPTIDYGKLTVARLKEIASEKGFTNFRKLRKQGLVQLLSN